MTRDDEQQGILVAGHPHSTACARVAQQGGKLSVGACRAVGNLLQRLPHTQLEGSVPSIRVAKSICWRVPFRYSVICRSASRIRGLGEEEVSQWSVSAMCVMAPCSSVSQTMPIGLLKVYVAGIINICCLCKVAINLYLLQLFRT